MSKRTCSINGCERTAITRGWCSSHYARWRHGRPMHGPFVKPKREPGTCTVDGCERKEFATKLCQPHYHRSRKYGDPLLGPPLAKKYGSLEERFWDKVDKTGDCWLWTAHCFHDGYGQFATKTNGKTRTWRAHRIAYELTIGKIPEGLLVDHMCHTRKCVNPAHLRLANRSQNNENRQGAQVNSKSGVRGVWWVEKYGQWEAVVMQGRARHRCGFFDDIRDAEAAVIAKRNELFTHNILDRV